MFSFSFIKASIKANSSRKVDVYSAKVAIGSATKTEPLDYG